jgi:transposase
MDGNASKSLVPLPPEQGSLVPVSSVLVAEVDARPNLLALLWRCFCKLAVLFFLLLALVRRLRLELIDLRLQANYWRAVHQRAVQRENQLKEQVQLLQGELREWKRRFFGQKSETSSSIHSPPNPNNDHRNNAQKRSRGQQPGSKGHGRRHHDHLTTQHEDCTLPNDQQCCAACGQPLVEIPGTADGDILEIEVRAHRRRYQRRRYRRH